MAAREIPGLATVLARIDDAMAPAAAWCERCGVSHMYELKELGDDGEIEDFMNAAGLKDFQKKLVKKRILELTRPPPSPGTVGVGPPAPAPAPPPAPSPTTKRAPPPRTSDATLCSPPKKTRQEEEAEDDDEPVFLAVKSEQDRTELARTRAVMTGDVIDVDDGPAPGPPDLAALAREREARRGPPPAPVATGAPLALNFGPVLKSMRTAPHVRTSVRGASSLLSAEAAALRNPSATWYWGLAGYVCIDGNRLEGAGDKTQICHSLCGATNKAPATIRTKKDALADAYANNAAVPARLGPVGSSAYTPQGTAHDWLYTSLEDAGRGGRTCEMDVGGRALRLREMNWRESKGPTKWTWDWRANVVGGYTPGVYLLVADQRAVQFSGGGKPYLMRMVGTLYPLAISPTDSATPAALEAAARNRLRALGRQGKSGGTDALAGYGSVRVDGLSGRRGAFADDAAPPPTRLQPAPAPKTRRAPAPAATRRAPAPAPRSAPAQSQRSAGVQAWAAQLDRCGWGDAELKRLLPEPLSRGDDAFLPVHEKVLHAFELVRPENVKCVVVGMCPYKKRDQACGLALSSPIGATKPPTLTHWIFGHLKNESINGGLGFHGRKPSHCDLTAWSTRAGVLLLNATLQGHKTGENAWRPFISRAIQMVCEHHTCGFIFMGNDHPRRLVSAVVGRSRSCVVATPYPGQFTRDDFNALQPFASVNRKLVAAGSEPVRWNALLD